MPAMPASRYLIGTLPWYSVLMVTAILTALLLSSREEKRLKLPKDTTVDLSLWLIPCGIVGARLYYVFFAWDTFADNPVSILYIWRGGLAIYGAIIAGAVAAVIFSRRRKVPLTSLLDMVAPGLVLAQAIGRWGNYFNMEAYGLAITDPAWQFFPAAVLINENGTAVWHMATFFYESLWDALTFLTLMLTRRRMTRRGDVFAWYVLLYGGGRLLVEGLRLDSLMTTGGTARISQLLSVLMCLTVLALFAVRTLRGPRGAQILAGVAGAAAGLALSLLLPRPEEAFLGYQAAFTVQAVIVLAALGMLAFHPQAALRRKLFLLLPLCALAFSFLVRIRLAQAGAGGVGASTILCAAFTLTCCLSAPCLYPAACPRDAADRLSAL